jgi:triphosphoribosyl-dephospho-CoA synthetase
VAARPSDDFLTQRIDDLRDEVRAGFAEVREEMRAGFAELRSEIRAVNNRVDQLFLTLVVGLFGLIATLLVKL